MKNNNQSMAEDRGVSSSVSVGKRACIVTGELAGPDYNGGIGTTNRALALELRTDGWSVDILYTRVDEGRPHSSRGSFEDHVAAYAKFGINLRCIYHTGRWNDWAAKSFLAMRYLMENHYKVVFFDDTHGSAYFPLLAKRTGSPLLVSTNICVTAHSATQWIYDLNETRITNIDEIRQMEMERRSIELADWVKAPSAYILKKYQEYGWTIPKNSVVVPNFISFQSTDEIETTGTTVNEIVFFGRLENRKGLWMFCRALDHLKFRLRKKTITFLGKPTFENGGWTHEDVLRWAASWPFEIRIISNFDHTQAISYLGKSDRIAIMPSPEDNSPSTILECIRNQIPFLACSGSGGEELLHESSRAENLFEPTVLSLCDALVGVLDRGLVAAAPAQSAEQIKQVFDAFVEQLLSANGDQNVAPTDEVEFVKRVLIVIVPPEMNPNRAAVLLRRAIAEHNDKLEIEVLCAIPELLLKELEADSFLPRVCIGKFSEFAKVAKSFSFRDATSVGICQVDQVLPDAFFSRSEACFSFDAEIAVVTGMSSSNESLGSTRTMDKRLEAHFSVDANPLGIERYLIGNSKALLSLGVESNSGFAVFRSAVLPLLAERSPFDELYNRPRRIEEWIHDLLLALEVLGQRFEIIPDLAVPSRAEHVRLLPFRLTDTMRGAAKLLYGYDFGSEQSILARVAIDLGLDNERANRNRDAIAMIPVDRQVAEKITKFDQLSRYEQLCQLGAVAHSNGQIELAVELCSAAAMEDDAPDLIDIAEFVDLEVHSRSLISEVGAGRFRGLNLDEPHSIIFREAERLIELHANSADRGMAGLVFQSVDLSEVDLFRCGLLIRGGEFPIRFKLELLTASKMHRWSVEKIVSPQNNEDWQIKLPQEARTECRILIGVEMADPDDSSSSAFAQWINPRFLRRDRARP